MHPLFHLIATRPQLLAEHAEAYAALIAIEVPRISAAWQRSALLKVLALCSLCVGVTLAGVSMLLWAALERLPLHAPWVLLAVPLLPLLVGAACAVAAQRVGECEALAHLRQQVSADLGMLREAALA